LLSKVELVAIEVVFSTVDQPDIRGSSRIIVIRRELRRANRDDAMLVSVVRDGKVFFRNDWTDPAELPARIRQCSTSGPERRVYIKADARVY